jgi:chorismate mutase
MEKLQKIRGSIQKTDKQIIKLLKKRLELSEIIAKEKITKGIKILDNFRENELHEIYKKAAKAFGMSEKFIKDLFNVIFAESRRKQKQSRQIDDKAKK